MVVKKAKTFGNVAVFSCSFNGKKAQKTIGIALDKEVIRDEFETDDWMSLSKAKRLQKNLNAAIWHAERVRP